jgi:2,4-dienoyl-CoA reductase-like NADH-dependent reductase (Old Yellow Enzyme family)
VSYLTAQWPLATILSNAAQDPHPPFYYALLHFWFTLVPNSEISGRFLSLLLNLLLIPVIYLLAQELFGQRVQGAESPLTQPLPRVVINGKTIGNRWAIHPMEGWDATPAGGVTEEVRRRWQRFGESGAKLIYGGEAMAVRPEGRANPNQLILSKENQSGLAEIRDLLIQSHKERHGNDANLVIGFQLTHSGRFCRPNAKTRFEPRVAFRHPLLDKKFQVTSDDQILSDSEIEPLIGDYVAAAGIARDVGADFVDIKHCHGYLLHEFLGAHTRPGPYGGSFENRTRILRDIIRGIRASGNPIDIGVRLSAFDFVPFRPDPNLSQPGKPGPGLPEDYAHCLPYRFGFGVHPDRPTEYDLAETFQFVELCGALGVKLLNVSAGSPYYNPHIQRPAAYPPSDGYQPAHDPLIDVVRQIQVTRQLKAKAPNSMALVGTAYSYLQEFLPQVAQAVVRLGWTDLIGLGRMTLSYPHILSDAVTQGTLEKKLICRTFSDCTTAPRNGLISGCYPLDKYYAAKPEAQKLKAIKKG